MSVPDGGGGGALVSASDEVGGGVLVSALDENGPFLESTTNKVIAINPTRATRTAIIVFLFIVVSFLLSEIAFNECGILSLPEFVHTRGRLRNGTAKFFKLCYCGGVALGDGLRVARSNRSQRHACAQRVNRHISNFRRSHVFAFSFPGRQFQPPTPVPRAGNLFCHGEIKAEPISPRPL